MSVLIRSLETAVPATVLVQPEVRDVFAAQPGRSRLAQRLINTAFDQSGIDTRYSVLAEMSLTHHAENPVFFDSETGQLLNPGTGTRNALYAEHAEPLFVDAARRALAAADGIHADDVTHVVTASCTGFYAPGPDYQIVRQLDLHPGVQRYHIGFMGCYASFPALRAAKSFCEADPDAVVLVVSAELCSLHVHTADDPDTILGSSLFGDGAGAAVVSARPHDGQRPAIRLDHFETILTPVGEEAMAWNIGDNGFEMVLGTYVPHIIDEHIEGALAPLLTRDPSLDNLPYNQIDHWAIHPGGRSILDKVEAKLELKEDQLVPSRQTLRNYGNMSSATVLFVLKHILDAPAERSEERICAMAFGPGLTVESGLMTKLNPEPAT